MSYLEELLPKFRKGAKIRQKDWDEYGVYWQHCQPVRRDEVTFL